MNKKVIIVLVVILMTAVIAGGFWYVKGHGKDDVTPSNIEIHDDQVKNEQAQIHILSKDEKARVVEAFLNFLKKNDTKAFDFYKNKQQLDIDSLNLFEDKYLYGNISFTGSHSDPYILAIKKQSNWIVVFWGQDHPSCEIIDKYNIPNEIYDVCFPDDSEIAKKDLGVFTITYPQSWHWVNYDMQFGGFITNNKNIASPWTSTMADEDVKIIMSTAPLSPYSEQIKNVVNRMDFELRHDQNFDAKKYSNMTCSKSEKSQFDVEYLCYYDKDGVYYRSISFGLENSSVDGGAILYSITASSKNVKLIEEFSIDGEY